MESRSDGLKNVALVLIILAILTYFMIWAKTILVPIAFGIFLAFMLKPVADRVERVVKHRLTSIFVAIVIVLIPILGAMWVFGQQFINIVTDIPQTSDNLMAAAERSLARLQNLLPNGLIDPERLLSGTTVSNSLTIITTGITRSGAVFVNLLLTILYTIFFLLYRSAFKSFVIMQFPPASREQIRNVSNQVQLVSKEYLYGLLMVMLILGILYSTGLYFIGINYSFFWGFLGAILAVIPYVGTVLGGLLPFLYALATTGTTWQPLAVAGLIIVIQNLEGNFITPKVVGSSVKINPLASIVALFFGGFIWGVSGLILAIPTLAIIRVAFSRIDVLKPVSHLLSSDLAANPHKFYRDWDHERYRLLNYFFGKQTITVIEDVKLDAQKDENL